MATTTKVAHTPGPWEVVRHRHVDDELWLSVNQHEDANGMKEWVAEIKYLTTDPDRQWANARLIAAAPDLLSALRDVVAGWEKGDDVYGPIQHARAVIARAEGRT